MAIVVVFVWPLVFRISPGLALIVVPLTVLAVDRYDPAFLDGRSSHWIG